MKLNLSILNLCLLGILVVSTLAFHGTKQNKIESESSELQAGAKAKSAASSSSAAKTADAQGAVSSKLKKAIKPEKKTIYKTKAEIEQEKVENSKAAEIYTTKPEGRDGFEVLLEGELNLQIFESGQENESPALPFHFRLNKNALYYSDKARSYRGIFGAFPLENMISSEDVPESGKCCSRLASVKQAKVKQSGKIVTQYCFKITGTTESWNICSKDDNLIREWNKKVKIQIIIAALIKKGRTNVEVMIPEEKTVCENNNDWTWKNQADWKCMCKEGKNQSPLILNTEKSKNVMNIRLQWSYIEVATAQAKFNGHEVELYGDFGKFVKQKLDSQKSFNAFKITFKFPSEHMIDGNKYDGEILVHHKDEEDKLAILSVLLIEDYSNDSEYNEFIDNIDAETWKHEEGAPVNIDSKPSLEQIVKGGANKFLKKSFFWYQGSLSSPPCEENVLRVVMRDPIKVPSVQLQILRKVAFPNNDESDGNARKPIEPTERVVSYHLDMSPTCESPNTSALIKEVEEKIADDAAKEVTKNEIIDHKFVKATNTIPSYGITGGEPITGDIGNGITLNYIKPDDIPDKIKKNLVLEANDIYKNLKLKAEQDAKVDVDKRRKAEEEAAEAKKKSPKGDEDSIEAEVQRAINRYYY